MKGLHFILGLAGILVCSGCGYFYAGEWEDDPGNWARVFGGSPPEHVEVVHSSYWRSPHWTFEFEYFFHLRSKGDGQGVGKTVGALFAADELKAYDPGDKPFDIAIDESFGDTPEWFCPKPVGAYDVFIYKEPPYQHMRIFVDKETSDVFVTDFQY